MKINLRGHHLLCIQGFQGYGYSEEFVNNMEKIQKILSNDNVQISISNSPDDICKKCPNLTNNICKNNEANKDIVKMDDEVIAKLKINEPLPSKELFKLVNNFFNSKDQIEIICKNCKWFNKCLFVNNL